jgi:rubredoxin
MKNYRCEICGHIYEPADGDPDNGVKAGTAFESLPERWVCPICGAEKSEFVEEA